VLKTLVDKCPSAVVGVGTVMDADVALLPEIASIGEISGLEKQWGS
jgi:hypothetical protein